MRWPVPCAAVQALHVKVPGSIGLYVGHLPKEHVRKRAFFVGRTVEPVGQHRIDKNAALAVFSLISTGIDKEFTHGQILQARASNYQLRAQRQHHPLQPGMVVNCK